MFLPGESHGQRSLVGYGPCDHRVGPNWETGSDSQVALVVKNPPANTGDARYSGSIPGLGQSPGVGNGTLLQNSCLKTSMERGAWGATVRGATKNQTRLRLSTHRRGMRLRLINRIRDGQAPVPSLIRSTGAETLPSHSRWGTSQSAWLWWMVMKMTAVVLGAGLLWKRTMCQALC